MKKTGLHTCTDEADIYSRRKFLQSLLGLAASTTIMDASCTTENPLAHIKGSIVGANHETGHLLRNNGKLPAPTEERYTRVLIVGGGIAGLSARRWLNKKGVRDVLLVEMDTRIGGNSTYGANAVSAYPWAAHYLPIPDTDNENLIDFLKECNAITGINEDRLPIYNEYFLCHDPEERLYINGYWQEGLVPNTGIPLWERKQTERFFNAIEQYKVAIGNDGKYAFAIPLDNSSADVSFRKLDGISFSQYLKENGYTAPSLLWYLEYSCKDDYGCNLDNTSAWAGIHYFAGRKGKAANASPSAVLTWPEGNGYLMEHLKGSCNLPINSSLLIYDIEEKDNGVIALAYDVQKKKTIAIHAAKILLSTPQYVTKHLLHKITNIPRIASTNSFNYAPWVIANITLNGLPQGKGQPLCWDNVLYNTPSVGYVNANHQNLNDSLKKVFTYYLPLVDETPTTARSKAYNKKYEDWVVQIISELSSAHHGIEKYIEHVDLWIWGHGMIAPAPGFIWGKDRQAAMQPINNKVFFAHSDLSGISIFEEAFHQGIKAANEILSAI